MPVRGVDSKNEIPQVSEIRDIRSNGQKFAQMLESSNGSFVTALVLLGCMWEFPSFMEFFLLVGLVMFYWVSKRKFVLPFRMPQTSGLKDPNDPDQNDEPGEAKGIAFLGNEMKTRRELWFTSDDMRTHLLVFGSTGAGKALRKKEWIHTPDGWVRNEDLNVGDRVSTPDGGSSEVVGIYPQGTLSLWRVSFEDGRRIDVSGDHLWEIAPYGQPQADAAVVSTVELQSRLHHGSTHGWAVPMTMAPDAPAVSFEQPLVAQAAVVAQGLLAPDGHAVRPDARLRNASAAQRRSFWQALLANAAPQGAVRSFNGQHLVALGSVTLGEDLQFLARSLGHWAALEASSPAMDLPEGATHVLTVRERPAQLKVTYVEQLDAHEDCQCIKIADPRGLFVTRDWVVTHNTETLISLAFNALVQGSGFIYVDGKGDNSLWAKIFAIARSVGREDDVLVINYMTGGRDVFGPQATKLSNTLNPFISGSAGGLTELLVGLMDEAGGDNAMWKGRAISLVSGIMMALVWMRDNTGLLIDVDVIRNHLLLENIQKLATRRDLPTNIIQALRGYLVSLPGYQEKPKDGKQSETVMDQHGYLQMQFTKILGSLSDTYGYIFRTNLGEVDFFDVVVNRRILCVLLPALEKSIDELANLGKIIVACLKQMMATGLGDSLEGDYADVIEVKPTNSPAPYMCILDEYGYYVVKGAAVMPAQARSLGFCMVFAGQDYPAFKKNNNAEEAVSTIGNCNIKIFMKVEDPTETFDLFKQSVGEALVAKTGGFQLNQGALASYGDMQNASLERRSRGDWLDLKDQRPGEAHIIFKSTLVRAKMFYAKPERVNKLQLNHFLRVEPPEKDQVLEFDTGVKELTRRLLDPRFVKDLADSNDRLTEIDLAMYTWGLMKDQGASVRDAAAAVVAAQHRSVYAEVDNLRGDVQDLMMSDEDSTDRMNVFSTEHNDPNAMSDEDYGVTDPMDDDGDESAPTFLNEEKTRERFVEVEMAGGDTTLDEANQRAEQAVEDMRKASEYPRSQVPEDRSPDDILDIIQEIGEDLDPNAAN